jgi:hypothetical protein
MPVNAYPLGRRGKPDYVMFSEKPGRRVADYQIGMLPCLAACQGLALTGPPSSSTEQLPET